MRTEKEELEYIYNTFDFNIFRNYNIPESTQESIASYIKSYVKERLDILIENEKKNLYDITPEEYQKGIKYAISYNDLNDFIKSDIQTKLCNVLRYAYANSTVWYDHINNIIYANTWCESGHNGDAYDNKYKKIPFANI